MATTKQIISRIQQLGGFIEVSNNMPAEVKTKLDTLVLQGTLCKAPETEVSYEIYFFPSAIDAVAEYIYQAIQEVKKIAFELSK